MTQKSPLSVRIAAVTAAVYLLAATSAYAATPTLSLVSVGGDSAQISVTGDPNASVMFYYNVGSASGMQATSIGSTNTSGSFSTTISASSYAIIAGDLTYVIVNGQQSTMQTWPSPTTSSGVPTLSQTSVTVGLGQSTTVTSQANSGVYVSSNSSPSVATVTANGTQLTVTGVQLGSTMASICFVGTASNCTNLSVTVQSGSTSTALAFSQNNISLSAGGNQAVVISGGGGTYNISGNSNTGVVSTNFSGSTLTVYALAAGNATVTVCDQSGNCGLLYVTVGSGTTSGSLSFSPTSPSILVGQVFIANISGGTGYYVSSNSNASVASSVVNGSTLTISGLESGTTTITVCSASNGCGSVYVTVGSTSANPTVTFGVTSPTITVGQSMNIGLSGGSNYVISSNANANIVQASVSGSSLVLYGSSVGSDSVAVCASGGGCNTLSVTVNSASTTTSTQTPVVNGTLLTQIQSLQSVVVQVLSQIQSIQNQLAQLVAQVSSGSGNSNNNSNSNTTSASPAASSPYYFTEFLNIGSQDAEVTALQQRLSTLGFYSGPVTGFYGALTEAAVKQYQTKHGILPATGYIGPSTRTALNAGN